MHGVMYVCMETHACVCLCACMCTCVCTHAYRLSIESPLQMKLVPLTNKDKVEINVLLGGKHYRP